MATIGKRNSLRVVRGATPGLYLDGEELGEILLPRRYIPKGIALDEKLDVFVYRDSEDRLVATTETPRACVGEFAALRVISVSRQLGAFLDWGLSKDLLLPIREQAGRVPIGELVVVGILLDAKTGRIVATMRLNDHLGLTAPAFAERQRVHVLIASETPLGYKAIVENAHWGLFYRTDISTPLTIGQEFDAYVREVRPDGKIDLRLDLSGRQRVVPLALQILDAIKANDGQLDFDDDSSPEEIRARFATSKKAFKQALGTLFRGRRIQFTKPGIRLADAAQASAPKSTAPGRQR